jgi:ArsR family transcriptional regulator
MSKYRTVNIEKLSGMFKALSNPQRLKIFIKLARCCAPVDCCILDEKGAQRCVGDLGGDLGLAPSTVSHHIKELRLAGLVNIQRKGQKIECWTSRDILLQLAGFFAEEDGEKEIVEADESTGEHMRDICSRNEKNPKGGF